ncbi:hypothetical protein [Donghicola sp. XS_ASV15]|uniref:hypothetical protein n=1 Tax=Donghicola sp. XS_ASV15 TaxID=3241295 RepID=UPI003515D07D
MKTTNRRIIIHAGLHKTASSSLQYGLFRNRNALAKAGVVYPVPPRGYAQHHLVALWNEQLRQYLPHTTYEQDWRALNDIAPGKPVTVVVSSEEFSRKAPETVDFEQLIQLTPSFDSHEIVVVLRDQVTFLQSVFLQIRDHNRLTVFPEWVQNATQNPHNPGLFFDYSELHDFLLHAFEPEKISFLNYSSFGRHPLGVVGSFVDHIGYGDTEGLQQFNSHNVSEDPLGYYLGRELLNGVQPSDEQIEKVASVLKSRHPGKVKTSLYTKEQVSEWTGYFRPLNEKFHATAGDALQSPIVIPEVQDQVLYLCEVTDADRQAVSDALSARE